MHSLAPADAAPILGALAGSEDIERALGALAAETSVSRLLKTTCVELTRLLDVPRVTISRTIGDLLVELGHHDTSGADPALELFLVTDYPLTQEVIESREPRTVLLGAAGADPAESALLTRLGFDSLLMLPLRSRGQNWGLVEIWGRRAFGPEDAAQARALVERVGELLADIERGV